MYQKKKNKFVNTCKETKNLIINNLHTGLI